MYDLNETPIDRTTTDILPPLTKKCRLLAHTLHALSILLPLLFGIWIGNDFGWLYGVFAWLAATFAVMIVMSKLKIATIPHDQHELPHSTATILAWVVAKRFCDR